MATQKNFIARNGLVTLGKIGAGTLTPSTELEVVGTLTSTGAVVDNIQIGITGTNEIDTISGNLTIDSAGGTVTIDDNLTVTGTITGSISGNASTASALETARTIAASGDATWSVSFNGNENVTSALTLATTGVSAGTYQSVTVDAKGRVTAGTNPTTLSGYGITDAQALDSKLTSISGLSGSSTGLVKLTNGVASLDTTSYVSSSLLGANDGVATLDSAGKVPTSQLPSYVDDVVEYNNLAAFPATGEGDKIYVAKDTGKIYRWSGSTYIEISASASNADTATKLATARTLWGQSFDGSANVSGNLTSVGNITGTAGVTLTATSGTLALAATGANIITASTDGSERMRLDSSGNLGLGVTPNASWSGFRVFQLGSLGAVASADFGGGNTQTQLSSNAYYDGTNFRYLTTNTAQRYNQIAGSHVWLTAPSGTAGNTISFTQAMTLSASGGLSIGATSDAGAKNLLLDAGGKLCGNAPSGGTSSTIELYNASTGNMNLTAAFSSAAITFASGGTTERMRLDSAGNLGLGVTPSAWNTVTALQVKNASLVGYSSNNYLSANAYYESAWKYITSNRALQYIQEADVGQHQWFTAASGTAGNAISFTQAMTLDASGNLGVGTTSISARLHIKNGAGGSDNIRLENSNSTRTYGIVNGLGSSTDGVFSIYDYTASASRITIDTSGNVGIGTTSPAAKLQVGLLGGGVRSGVYVPGLINWSGAYLQQATSDGRGAELTLAGHVDVTNSSAYKIYVDNDSAPRALIFSYASDAVSYSAATFVERMRMDSNGNLGIGTSSPGASLHVAGAINATPTGSGVLAGLNSNYGQIKLYGSNGGILDFGASGGDGKGRILYNNTSNYMAFGTTNGVEQMRLDTSGNLGLGVTPSTWFTSGIFQGPSFSISPIAGVDQTAWTTGAYQSSYLGSWLARGNWRATMYQHQTGAHAWFTCNTTPAGAGSVVAFTQAMTLDSSGNLGLGVTPSASNLASFQSPYGIFIGNNEAHTTKNAYYSSGWKYVTTAVAARFAVGEGGSDFRWYNAASGTAGNAITFTQAMTLDASGNVQVGTTTGSSRMTLAVPSAISTARTVLSLTDETQASVSFILHTDLVRMATGGSDALAFETNGSERMRITSAGLVGIGVTSPSTLLHVGKTSTDGVPAEVRVENAGATGSYGVFRAIAGTVEAAFYSDAAGNALGVAGATLRTISNNPFIFGTNNTERMRIASGGNVAIGSTDTSLGRLNVVGSAASSIPLVIDSSASYGEIQTYNSSPLWLNRQGNNIIIGGNVGIGTSSPGAKLDVSGGDIRLATNATYYRSVTSGGTSVRMLGINAGNVAYIGPIDSGPTDAIFNASSTSTVAAFYTNGTEKVRITSAGDVGIGTSSPLSKLTVQQSADGFDQGITISRAGANRGTIFLNASNDTLNFGRSTATSMTLDSSGNLGLGITTSVGYGTQFAVGSTGAGLAGLLYQSVNTNDERVYLTNNAQIIPGVWDGGNLVYVKSGASATAYRQISGSHQWLTAASGTAGNTISFTQAMTLSAGGNLGIGTTSPTVKFELGGNTANTIQAALTSGADNNFKLYAVNGSATNASGEEVARFGVGYGGNVTTYFSAGFSFIRGGGAEDGALAILTNTTERMRITSAGNLGIGTSSPSRKFEVWGAPVGTGGASTGVLGVFANNSTAYNASPTAGISFWNKYNSSGSAFPSAVIQGGKENSTDGNYAGYLAFITIDGSANNTERMRIDSAGRVGIGTTTPSYDLNVSRTGVVAVSAATSNTQSVLRAEITGNVALDLNAVSGYGELRTANNYPLLISTNAAERIRVTTAGDVGIGTSSPSAFNGYTTVSVNNATNGGIYNILVNGTETARLQAYSGVFNVAAKGASTVLMFETNAAERMRIDSAGNVGIGTTSPAYKLEVNGSFAATTKSFIIDHPTKPGMKLRYGSLEGPENGVYVRGKLEGSNVIELPEYWTKLVDAESITVQLTSIGKQQQLFVEDIRDNKVYVGGLETSCYFTVFAERVDVEKLEVEIM